MKSKETRLAGYVTRIEEKRINGFDGKTWRKETTGRPRHRWMIILKWILKKYDVKAWDGCIWLKIGILSGCCEHGNKP
jgi:hypothetical protein